MAIAKKVKVEKVLDILNYDEILKRFQNEVIENTLNTKSETIEIPKLSEKVLKLQNIIYERSFGCKTESVRVLVEAIIGEKIPPKNLKKTKSEMNNILKKYNKKICRTNLNSKLKYFLIIERNAIGVDLIPHYIGTSVFNNIEICSDTKIIDEFFKMFNGLISYMGGFKEFLEDLNENFGHLIKYILNQDELKIFTNSVREEDEEYENEDDDDDLD